MSMGESIVYLSMVTVIGFAVIMALYLLYKKMEHKNEKKIKTKAEK